ncbi:host cell division inhibitor Icd-like protein [Yersinia enterocolitica]|nr:host cell division inhibitor Icd-like protein [Yersinia enterocolitica]
MWNPVYIKKEIKKELKWNPVDAYTGIHLIVLFAIKLAKPRSATNTIWASNHNVIGANTMACQHSTQTHPKFQYLFLAVCRSDLNAKPHRESVTAHSEQDARRSLAGQFVLSFAGRIPAQGVCNA